MAIKWQNGMVMVFDVADQQLAEYQGRYEDVREKLLADAPPTAVFQHGVWGQGTITVQREAW